MAETAVIDKKNNAPSPFYKTYSATGLSADVDLTTDWPGWVQGKRPKAVAQIIWSGGDIVVQDYAGNSETLGAVYSPATISPKTLVDTGTTSESILVIWQA